MRADSTEYVVVPIPTYPTGVDLTIDSFAMAFAATKDSIVTGPAWHAAVYTAGVGVKLLVGPGAGGTVIAPGAWVVLLKIVDNPEIPVIAAPGKFTITAVV